MVFVRERFRERDCERVRVRMRGREDTSGFTLIEIMVVLLILGILAGLIVPRLVTKPEAAKRTKAATDIHTMETLLDQFYLDMGRYPTSEEGLRVLYYPPTSEQEKWQGPYPTKPIGKDPWGNAYIYRCPGPHPGQAFEIISYGRDGQPGGEGDNADVSSWVDEETP